MGVSLTFTKSFEHSGAAGMNNASLAVCTTDGEWLENVLAVEIEQPLESQPIMTIKVRVIETFAENAAARLKK